MLTLKDIKPPKREYWINVYLNGLGPVWTDKYAAMMIAKFSKRTRSPVLYRIHVKLKDEKH